MRTATETATASPDRALGPRARAAAGATSASWSCAAPHRRRTAAGRCTGRRRSCTRSWPRRQRLALRTGPPSRPRWSTATGAPLLDRDPVVSVLLDRLAGRGPAGGDRRAGRGAVPVRPDDHRSSRSPTARRAPRTGSAYTGRGAARRRLPGGQARDLRAARGAVHHAPSGCWRPTRASPAGAAGGAHGGRGPARRRRPAGRCSPSTPAAARSRTLAERRRDAGHDGRPSTLDRALQTAAEDAVEPVAAAGDDRGDRSRPPASCWPWRRTRRPTRPGALALTGRYPPGSTFKIVTAVAALRAGRAHRGHPGGLPGHDRDRRPGRCPNADEFDQGTVPLHSAFAFSCNTTFAQLAVDLAPDALTDRGARSSASAWTSWCRRSPRSPGRCRRRPTSCSAPRTASVRARCWPARSAWRWSPRRWRSGRRGAPAVARRGPTKVARTGRPRPTRRRSSRCAR